MKDKLEDFVRDNRAEFDLFEPTKKSFVGACIFRVLLR